jgi:hypothetical protein
MGNQIKLVIPFETPERGKYQANKAKDYIIELADGKKAYIWDRKDGPEMCILGPGKDLRDCRIGLGHTGVGLVDEKNCLYVFYDQVYVGHVGGRPIYVGKIIKWRRHSAVKTLAGHWSTYKPAENKLYFVTNRWENSGFYVIARNPQQARYQVYDELDCDYLDSRARRIRFKDEWRLGEYRENVVIYPDDQHILGHLGIEYYEPEEE